jgi:hypothetical protein
MLTKAANDFLEELKEEAKKIRESAKFSAVEYAESDNPACKARFQAKMEEAQIYDKMHSRACQVLNAVEQEMLANRAC